MVLWPTQQSFKASLEVIKLFPSNLTVFQNKAQEDLKEYTHVHKNPTPNSIKFTSNLKITRHAE